MSAIRKSRLANAFGVAAFLALTAPVAAQAQIRIEVDENWPAYQAFERDRDTHFFADDGLNWESFKLELVRGTKNADGSCSMDLSRAPIPGQRLSSSTTLHVAQAVNHRTCETLFKRGKATLRKFA